MCSQVYKCTCYPQDQADSHRKRVRRRRGVVKGKWRSLASGQEVDKGNSHMRGWESGTRHLPPPFPPCSACTPIRPQPARAPEAHPQAGCASWTQPTRDPSSKCSCGRGWDSLRFAMLVRFALFCKPSTAYVDWLKGATNARAPASMPQPFLGYGNSRE
jgi:hypothetical protein